MRGFSESEITKLGEARDTFARILGKSKTIGAYRLRDGLIGTLNLLMRDRAPKLGNRNPDGMTKEESQIRRNEVLKMRQERKPGREIPIFRGVLIDGDPIRFFQSHYARYIRTGSEVIFTTDLSKIDSRLLTALRNTVEAKNMPIQSMKERTNAVLEGRFKDPEDTLLRLAENNRRRKRAYHKQ